MESNQRYQITCSKYAAYNPCISKDGKTIYYNNQSKDGMDVVKINFDPTLWKPWTKKAQPSYSFAHLVEQEGHPDLLKNIPQENLKVKKYSRLKGIINPYSWGGYFTNDLTQVNLGITSRDLLSTTTINAGYLYDLNERSGAWKATVSYQGLFPIIDFSVSQGDRTINKGPLTINTITGPRNNRIENKTTKDLIFDWTERNIETGLRIPLITTTSKFIGNFSFGNAVGVTQITDFRSSFNNQRTIPTRTINDSIFNAVFVGDIASNGSLIYNHFSLSAYRLLKQSRRDINSKWGQSLNLNIYNTPFGGGFSGSQFSVYGLIYLPGLFKHHSLWGYWAYQNSQLDRPSLKNAKELNQSNNYQFRNQIPLPRGGLGVSRFQDFYSLSINYAMPVWYPDIAFGPLVNLQRIRANGFFDYGYGSSPKFNDSETFVSTGIEVKLDLNVMRLLPQFDIGFRYSIGLKPSTSLFELLIGTFNF
jgi:hypothetical protein